MLRMLEVYHPCLDKSIEELLEKFEIIDLRKEKHGKNAFTRILIDAEESESIIATLERIYGKYDNFRLIIVPVEASVPRREEERKEEKERLSVEEIYEDLTNEAKISHAYVTLVILASITAAIGIIHHDVAIIIGSMVIAPLLAPNMALALSATLADKKLAKQALLAGITGYIIAFIVGIIFGFLFHIRIEEKSISHIYILLAFVAGIAGSLSITKGVIEAIVGVMVAVAILPPLVASGILFGQLHIIPALGSLLLFAINVVGINLAAIVTFLVQGIEPRTWWKRKKAEKTIWLFISIWLSILLLLAILIYLYENI